MKILMLTPYVPYPPSSGGQIRTLNLLKYLSKNNAITLVALYKSDKEKDYFFHLKTYCKNIYLCRRPEKPWKLNTISKAIFSLSPFLVIRNFSYDAKKTVSQLLKQTHFDVIHAETFYIMPHIPKTNIPILLVEQTIEYKVYQHFVNSLFFLLRPFLSLDILKLKYWERFYWRKANLVAAVSSSDEKIINQLEPKTKTTIIPNGAGDEMIAKRLKAKDFRHPTILFQGNFYWLQNVEAALFLINNIYPLLTKKLPHLQIIISGQNAKKLKIKKSSSLKIIDNQPEDQELVKNYFQKATIFIAPIFGPGGTRLKILAAMAAGIPVISTKTGLEGLAIVNEKHALVAHTAQEFASQIIRLLNNKQLYEQIRTQAYGLIKEKYNWKKISEKLEQVYHYIEKK
jgi:glycosyltransferase involved in cell wall biosynthesis